MAPTDVTGVCPTAQTFLVIGALVFGDFAAAQSAEKPGATSEIPSQTGGLPRLALRGLVGIGAASAAKGFDDVGFPLGVVLDWWPEPWGVRLEDGSTRWMTSWSFGFTVQRNTFTHYINGAPPPGVSLTSSVWEPYVDVGTGFYTPRGGSVLGRFRLGIAAYIGTARSTDGSSQQLTTHATGGAIRFSFGLIGWPDSPVGLAVDWVLEGGWIGSSAVGSAQVLIGPSFHLWRQ